MPGPVLVAVDEDADLLSAVEAELLDRYARDYTVICERSAEGALATLYKLAGGRRRGGARARRAVAVRHDGRASCLAGCTTSTRTRSAVS